MVKEEKVSLLKEIGGINQEFGSNRNLEVCIHKYIYKIDKQQDPTVQPRELYSISYNNL